MKLKAPLALSLHFNHKYCNKKFKFLSSATVAVPEENECQVNNFIIILKC